MSTKRWTYAKVKDVLGAWVLPVLTSALCMLAMVNLLTGEKIGALVLLVIATLLEVQNLRTRVDRLLIEVREARIDDIRREVRIHESGLAMMYSMARRNED